VGIGAGGVEDLVGVSKRFDLQALAGRGGSSGEEAGKELFLASGSFERLGIQAEGGEWGFLK
jgi:hypothetical protein